MERSILKNRARAIFAIIIVLIFNNAEICAQGNEYMLISSDFIVFRPGSQFVLPEGCYNCLDEQYLIGARVISKDSQENYTVYHFNKELVNDSGCNKPGTSIVGDSIIEEQSGRSSMFSSRGDTLTIDRSLLVGESSRIFEFENGDYILTHVISHDLEAFNEVTDSVKTYSLQLFDMENNPIDGLINTQEVKISKSYGMIKFFNVRDFPYTEFAAVDLELETNSQLDYSSIFYTYGDVNNFNVGDEFHYNVKNIGYGPDGYIDIKREVIAKEVFVDQDSVSYTFRDIGHGLRIKYVESTFIYEPFALDTIYESSYNNLSSYVLEPDRMPFEAFLINETILGNALIIKNEDKYNGRYSTRLFGSELTIQDECAYPPHDSHHFRFTYYIEGCGSLINDITAEVNEECNKCEQLLYFKKGDETWGEPLGFYEKINHPSPFKIYPNPAQDHMLIESRDEIQLLQIYSVHGILINSFNVKLTRDYQIDLSGYEPGLYFIVIRTTLSDQEVLKVVVE